MTDISDFYAASIFPVILPASFGQRDFKISYLAALKKRAPSGVTAPIPVLTESQLADYEKYGYKCRDRLDIPGLRPKNGETSSFSTATKLPWPTLSLPC